MMLKGENAHHRGTQTSRAETESLILCSNLDTLSTFDSGIIRLCHRGDSAWRELNARQEKWLD